MARLRNIADYPLPLHLSTLLLHALKLDLLPFCDFITFFSGCRMYYNKGGVVIIWNHSKNCTACSWIGLCGESKQIQNRFLQLASPPVCPSIGMIRNYVEDELNLEL